jgi:polyhydroxybutyrate depolymerase
MCISILLLIVQAAPALAVTGRAAIRSSGCGAAPPELSPTVVNVDGLERPLLIVVAGGGYDANVPHDLVIAFHGRTNANTEVRGYYDLERYAQRPTVFVYPTGLPTHGSSRGWSDPGDSAAELRDYALFDVLVLRLARLYCLDLGRVFAVGHSLGATFVDNLACARGGKLRAIATVAGDMAPFACSGPVAALLFHSPKDELVSFSRGEATRNRFLAINGLRGPPAALPSGDLNCVRYGGQSAENPVVWCPHGRTMTWRGNYYPHQWPREAGMMIMAFFASLP